MLNCEYLHYDYKEEYKINYLRWFKTSLNLNFSIYLQQMTQIKQLVAVFDDHI